MRQSPYSKDDRRAGEETPLISAAGACTNADGVSMDEWMEEIVWTASGGVPGPYEEITINLDEIVWVAGSHIEPGSLSQSPPRHREGKQD